MLFETIAQAVATAFHVRDEITLATEDTKRD